MGFLHKIPAFTEIIKCVLYSHLGLDVGLYNTGVHYFSGKGVPVDFSKAAEYFTKAAYIGFDLAQVSTLFAGIVPTLRVVPVDCQTKEVHFVLPLHVCGQRLSTSVVY